MGFMNRPECIEEGRVLAGLTTFGIGGAARYFSEPSTIAEVVETYAFAREAGVPVAVLGGGSNVLVADAGVEAVVMRLGAEGFSEVTPDESEPLVWRVGAAAGLQGVLEKAAEAGLRGLEALAGIPGRIGGAAVMNAGGSQAGIGNCIEAAEGVDDSGGTFRLCGEALGFRYRGSGLAGLGVLGLSIRFAGRDEPEAIRARMAKCRKMKTANQPVGAASAGCVFANPSGDSAGRLLDRAGCKGMREGGAVVSDVHANFIVNAGGASSGDVARLAQRMRERVLAGTGIVLECEIRLWGKEPAFANLPQR